jgi:hypothetical protein
MPIVLKFATRPAGFISAVCDALRSTYGLVEPAARLLGMDGGNLRKYVRTHPRCVTVQIEARAKVVDLAESKLIHCSTTAIGGQFSSRC